MFSYTVNINRIKQPLGKIVAFASLLIEETLEVHGFRVINGAKGLFVSPPQHKGKGKDEEGNQVDKWYDDVRFIGDNSDDAKQEVFNSILAAYNDGANAKASAAKSQAKVNDSTDKGSRPLW